MNLHFIHDYETIGQDVFTCPVVNCAYYIFDWDRFTENPYSFEELIESIKLTKFDLKAQAQQGIKPKKSDMDWWLQLPRDVFSQLLPSEQDVDYSHFCDQITNYIGSKKVKFWWSRATNFDGILTERIFRSQKLQFPLPFYTVRDVRTYIDAKFDFKNKTNNICPVDDKEYWDRVFKPHNSIHDVSADILRLQKIVRVQEGLE